MVLSSSLTTVGTDDGLVVAFCGKDQHATVDLVGMYVFTCEASLGPGRSCRISSLDLKIRMKPYNKLAGGVVQTPS